MLPAAFETLDFRPDYHVEVDPEFPGDGDWHAPTTDQKQWIGTFTAGSTASTGVLRPPTRVVSVVLLRDSPTS